MAFHKDPFFVRYSSLYDLLFNDLFYFLEDLDIASYADDAAIYIQ